MNSHCLVISLIYDYYGEISLLHELPYPFEDR